MKLLHTADWHLGKRLYGVDRLDEARRALDEIAEIAREETPDAILVAGDLLDRRPVDEEPLGVCLEALAALADIAPVVVVTGNHDDEAFWGHLGPWMAGRGITLGHALAEPDAAVRTIETASGALHAALVPWPAPGELAQPAGADAGGARRRFTRWATAHVAAVSAELAGRRARGGVSVLVGHLMIAGARTGGGERALSLGPASAIGGEDLPEADYTALGHIHLAQPIPGAPGAAHYCGSPIALDFSESADSKGVLIAEVEDGATRVRQIPVRSGRPLVRLRGPLAGLEARAAEHPGALFSCEVEIAEPTPDLSRRVREAVPGAIRVEPLTIDAAADEPARDAPGGGDLVELYTEWYARDGRALTDAQRSAFAAALEAAD